MKHIYVNFKRFDIPAETGGVNRLSPLKEWASKIISQTKDRLLNYSKDDVRFTLFFPEAHLLAAADIGSNPVRLGCQGVYREDVTHGGNFGAFTTNRPAAAAKALGCEAVLIGHCEERLDKAGILAEAGVSDNAAVNRILNKEVSAAQSRGLDVLYCIGEKSEEQDDWQSVLRMQLNIGLANTQKTGIVIAYEPVWAIGPGKVPPDKEYIRKIAMFVKDVTGGLPVVYGGGLKEDNAAMLASIKEIDGGLIALTRFSGEIGFYPEEFLRIVEKYLTV
jgi:triosephosphate isomerase